MKTPWRVPYRWLPRTVLTNVRHIFGDIWRGVRNVVRWTPVIWFDADFDWEYLAEIMEYKLRRMSKGFAEHGVTVNSKRESRQMAICAELLRRLREDEYMNNAGYGSDWIHLPDNRQTRIVKHSLAMAEQDKRYFGTVMGKYLNHWWD